MHPIGPAPVMSTSSPTRLNDSAVCVALPKGSKIAAISSGMSSGILNALNAGITRYSANAPSRLTPTPTVLRQRWRRPARQLRQNPHVMWPSPETRSPTAKPRTSWPSSTISPTYSWPTCIGTGIVFCAHSSHFQIWISVPQIAVCRIRIITSLWPTSGFFTRASTRPGPRSSFANAFITRLLPDPSSHDPERPADAPERRHGAIDFVVGVRCAHLRADPGLALGQNGIGKADHIDTFGEQRVGHPRRELRVAQHYGDDRVLAGDEREARCRHRTTEPLAVRAHTPAQCHALAAS